MKERKYFVFDHEMHLFSDTRNITYFPKYKYRVETRHWPYMWMSGKPAPIYHTKEGWSKVEYVINLMDGAGIDMACLLCESFIDVSDYTRKFSTNGDVIEAVNKYPDRFVGVANVHPIIKRGVEAACEELEILVRDYGFKALKIYPPEETYINDERIFPSYEKCLELHIPAFIHTGGLGFYAGHNKYGQFFLSHG